jgi:plasmid stability protein
MATINLRDFPEHLHHQLKIQAAKEKTSIKAIVIRLVAEYLKGKDEE